MQRLSGRMHLCPCVSEALIWDLRAILFHEAALTFLELVSVLASAVETT